MLYFINIRVIDIIDILLVAFLMYQIYMWIKGTPAFNIFVGILSFYLLWRLVKALNMQLLSTILGQVIGVGVIALLIVFQQELRRLLLFVGTRYFSNMHFNLENIFSHSTRSLPQVRIKSIHKACNRMAREKTGALIVISRGTPLNHISDTGDRLDALTSSRLLQSIFFKNSPLHDGAVIIENERIIAARCVLPVSENYNLPAELGMRHRAGLGMSENTDAFVIIVSEETGHIAIAVEGEIKLNVSSVALMEIMQDKLGLSID